MEFDEERMEMVAGGTSSLFVDAANALESEMKEIAGTAVDNISSVVGNISSVYSALKQTTSDIQGTLESFASGSFEDSKKSLSVSSSEDNVSLDDTVSFSMSTTQDMENVSIRSKDSEALRVSTDVQPNFEDSLSDEVNRFLARQLE